MQYIPVRWHYWRESLTFVVEMMCWKKLQKRRLYCIYAIENGTDEFLIPTANSPNINLDIQQFQNVPPLLTMPSVRQRLQIIRNILFRSMVIKDGFPADPIPVCRSIASWPVAARAIFWPLFLLDGNGGSCRAM